LVKHELRLNKLACLRNNVQPDTSLMCAKTLGSICGNCDQYSLLQHQWNWLTLLPNAAITPFCDFFSNTRT